MLVIPLLRLVTSAYVVAGLYVKSTSTDRRRRDTFSALAGLAFFVVSTLFAIALEGRAEATEQVSLQMRNLLNNQPLVLEQLEIKLVVDLTSVMNCRRRPRQLLGPWHAVC
jgi:hypothetical protein